GIVGLVGGILGKSDINIAGMQVSRDRKGGKALVALSVDSSIPTAVLDEISTAVAADTARAVDLEI
ncbi:MAG: D-3-phosphoglycerate dehydrogenase / 2-oxoglutarate reductase, partial [Mycobacterium sp.]|nr:D-3-phosphoglycerate dehydrogenase / 2-oxoglutarate reductase [Mycobacterium sp.]